MRFLLAILIVAAMQALPCWGGEMAVLRNGFSIRHERREVIGAVTRLYVGTDPSSYVDVPSLEIDHFEEAAPEASSGSRLSAARKQNSVGLRTTALNTSPVVDLNSVVGEASERYRLDPDLVNSVIKAESGFNVRAVSPKGARGLMQLMPDTASKLGVPNAFDAQANVDGGTRYLRELLERYDFDLIKALAAYNAGPRRVEQYGGIPPYYETQAYVARIVRDFNKKKLAEKKAMQAAARKSASDRKKTQAVSAKPRQAAKAVDADRRASAVPASE